MNVSFQKLIVRTLAAEDVLNRAWNFSHKGKGMLEYLYKYGLARAGSSGDTAGHVS
jgi:hypothetical protein